LNEPAPGNTEVSQIQESEFLVEVPELLDKSEVPKEKVKFMSQIQESEFLEEVPELLDKEEVPERKFVSQVVVPVLRDKKEVLFVFGAKEDDYQTTNPELLDKLVSRVPRAGQTWTDELVQQQQPGVVVDFGWCHTRQFDNFHCVFKIIVLDTFD
jgi:hypothetical protein